jgi:hypothetical protein
VAAAAASQRMETYVFCFSISTTEKKNKEKAPSQHS